MYLVIGSVLARQPALGEHPAVGERLLEVLELLAVRPVPVLLPEVPVPRIVVRQLRQVEIDLLPLLLVIRGGASVDQLVEPLVREVRRVVRLRVEEVTPLQVW